MKQESVKHWSKYGSIDSNMPLDQSQGTSNSCVSEGTETSDNERKEPTFLGINRCTWFLSVFVLMYIAYLVVGGLIFSTLEAPEENKARQKLFRTKNKFLEKYHDVDGEIDFLLFSH